MCDCKGVHFGEFSNTVVIERKNFPEHMKEYSSHERIGIDWCIYQEVLDLWNRGITTCASCCGHNIRSGSIMVMEKDIEKMLDFGYENEYNACTYDTECCFYAKSVERVKGEE